MAGLDGLIGCAVFARNHEDRQLAKKKKSNIQIGKEEVKLSLPTEDTILYVESPKDPPTPVVSYRNLGKLPSIQSTQHDRPHFCVLKRSYVKEGTGKSTHFN